MKKIMNKILFGLTFIFASFAMFFSLQNNDLTAYAANANAGGGACI